MSVPSLDAHTDAVLARLASSGLPTGDGRRPNGAGWQGAPGASLFVTYLVVYLLDFARAGADASLADRFSDPVLHYQVTAVGVDRHAAGTAADIAARRLLNGVPLDVPGRSQVLITGEASLGAQRDEDVNPPLYFAVDRYRLDTTA